MSIPAAMTAAQPRLHWLRRLLGARLPARVGENRCVYVMGDIHGRRDLVAPLVARIVAEAEPSPVHNTLVFLGDYIDRGPDSKGVIDFLLSLDLPGWQIVFLRGNHEQSLLDFLDNPLLYRSWRSFGAPEMLLSYGVTPPRFDNDAAFVAARDSFLAQCPQAHLAFFRATRLTYQEGDYLFVHAGVRPGISLDAQRAEDLLWIRDDFLRSGRRLEKVIVHGHTPCAKPVRRANRIGLDTGAYATGQLTAAVLKGDQCRFMSTARQAA